MELIYNGPVDGPLFVFAHGAGAPATADFMEAIAKGLALHGIRVARFNFPYMQQRVDNGTRRPPERAPKLIAQYQQLITSIDQPMVIGGKSMGGRMASLVASDPTTDALTVNSKVKGIACLGFPFHPANKPESLRTEHFPLIKQAVFIAQGERDKLGTKEEVASYGLPDNIEWLWLEDGDHDLKPRVKSGFTHQAHLQKTIDNMAMFIKQVLA
ncbi:alpha/beta hydrolase [Moritella sp. 36]|uniref:alpha/beta family hydrolase n=1 Tax=unclassified Moritella TaxID=2637987 RepID=UPI001BAD0D75|nr:MULTISPECIES: alpha/beta family hydrolase [unclassified Moritella]QUM81918.1 alpha/beta hydrolase [Moritella sp. 5]QUM90433.1 alpha/beta hydrolase [Moritella sp. 36]